MKKEITLKELWESRKLEEGMYFAFPVNPDKEAEVTTYFTGYEGSQIFSNEGRKVHIFRYAGETKFGTLWFVGEPILKEIRLFGRFGYNNAGKAMNIICSGLISNLKSGVDAGALTHEQFSNLPECIKTGDYLLNGKATNPVRGQLLIPAVHDGKLFYKTLYRSKNGELGISGKMVPEIQVSTENESIRVVVEDSSNYGTTADFPYGIVYEEVCQEDNKKEEQEEEKEAVTSKTINQLIFSMEDEIHNMEKSIRHAEVILSGLRELSKK